MERETGRWRGVRQQQDKERRKKGVGDTGRADLNSDLFDQLKYNFGIVTWTVLKNHIIQFPIMSNFLLDNFKLNSCTLS